MAFSYRWEHIYEACVGSESGSPPWKPSRKVGGAKGNGEQMMRSETKALTVVDGMEFSAS